jgi:hypothetical protein
MSKKSIETLVNDLWWMTTVGSGAYGVTETFTQEEIKEKRQELIEFYYEELERVREEYTPATKADMRRLRGY